MHEQPTFGIIISFMSSKKNSTFWLRIDYTLRSLKSKLFENFLYTFGLIWLLIESLSLFFQSFLNVVQDNASLIYFSALLISLLISLFITIPKISIKKKFLASNTTICVKKGDLILEEGNIAITSSNYFDLNKHKKSSNSIKQQLIRTDFKDNLEAINTLIEESLKKQGIKGKKDDKKQSGKKIKYKVGTSVIIPVDKRKVFMVIMTKLNLKEGKKRTESNLDFLQKGLNSLWKLYDSEGNLEPLSIPVFGSGLSKISLSRLIFIQLIIMSYVSYARNRRITKQLNILINERNYNPEEFYQIKKFVKSIEF